MTRFTENSSNNFHKPIDMSAVLIYNIDSKARAVEDT